MSSIIQILIHLEKFLDYFEKSKESSSLIQIFKKLLLKIEKSSSYPIEIRELANIYNKINSKFKGTIGNNRMTFFIEFIKDLETEGQNQILSLFTGVKNIQIKNRDKIEFNYDENFIFYMVTLDKEKTYIDLVEENKKEVEDDKDCLIIEKIKKMPEILVINLEIDNINIDFEEHENIIVEDSKETYSYTLKGINKYTNFHSVA